MEMFRIMVKIQPSTICQVAAKKCVCNISIIYIRAAVKIKF